MLLHRMFRYEINVNLDDYISGLIAIIEDREYFTEDEDDQGSLTTNQKARLIINKLIKVGWVDREFKDGSFVEVLNLRDYSIKVLKLLEEISNSKMQEYNSLVFSSYSSLKQAMQEEPQRMYDALLAAKESTSRLVDELKSLYHNIRNYHRQISEINELNELIRDHFDGYKSLIDRIYHPIKTMDSVYRYSRPIQEILINVLGDDNLLSSMCKRAEMIKLYESDEKALEAIRSDIDFIMVAYQSIGGLVDDIDRKHSLYTRNSIQKIRYLLTADRSIKGKLISIMQIFVNSEGEKQEKILDILHDNIVASRQESFDTKSFYHKNIRSRRIDADPIQIDSDDIDNEDIEEMMATFKNKYPVAQVKAYILKLLENYSALQMRDILVNNDIDFVLLLIATVRASDQNMPYSAEIGEGYVEKSGYYLPDITFTRRERP